MKLISPTLVKFSDLHCCEFNWGVHSLQGQSHILKGSIGIPLVVTYRVPIFIGFLIGRYQDIPQGHLFSPEMCPHLCCCVLDMEIIHVRWSQRPPCEVEIIRLYCRRSGTYRKVSNIRRTLVDNKIVDHSDVVGASPVGAAPTTSSFST